MRTRIRQEIASIAPHDASEAAHIADALAWVDSGAELFRISKPSTPPKHLVAYFAVLDDGHILLVDHKNAQLWQKISFDKTEFNAVKWFEFGQVPLHRSDPHLGRFMAKLDSIN